MHVFNIEQAWTSGSIHMNNSISRAMADIKEEEARRLYVRGELTACTTKRELYFAKFTSSNDPNIR